MPTEPTRPREPTGPSQRTGPSEPTVLTGQTERAEATEPTGPTRPHEPTGPSQRTGPSRLTEPTRQTEPAESAELADPAESAGPTGPAESAGLAGLAGVDWADRVRLGAGSTGPTALTEPMRLIEDVPLFDTEDLAAGEAEDGDGGGRRADGERRWPWLVGLGVLAVLAVSGVIWMLAAMPRPAPAPIAQPATSAPATDQPSTPDAAVTTVSRWPTVSVPVSPGRPAIPAPANTLVPVTQRAGTRPPTRTLPVPSVSPLPPVPLPGLVRVPNVVGLRQATAAAALRAAGFRVSAVPVEYAPPRTRGRVVAQAPLGGARAPHGSLVTIFIGTG